MSGFIGTVHLDGLPVDPSLLQKMTASVAFRGPDASNTHIDGAVGMGHTLLRTTPEARQEQPCSLDGDVWIVSDARIDGRPDLISELRSRGREVPTDAPDVELILHAYAAWGEGCARHLLGDFSFAIWDRRSQRLFCARDHFGVRPFYVALVGAWLIVSNTLEAVRCHPAVSDTLNEQYIGDFLLIGSNCEPATTVYSDIRRLPAGHILTYSAHQGLKQESYWSLPTDGCIRYKRSEEYVEHFSALFHSAVQDRVRNEQVTVFMSGGLDSAAVAAVARGVLPEPNQVCAVTTVFDRLMPDKERHYSGLVAAACDIPIRYQAADDYKLYERFDRPELHLPEPMDNAFAGLQADYLAMVSEQSRVALTGLGGDPALYPTKDYFLNLLMGGRIFKFARDIAEYKSSQGRLPPLYLRSRLRRWVTRQPRYVSPYPKWLNREFSQRQRLPERWQEIMAETQSRHPVRPDAYDRLTNPFWTTLFERWDAGTTLQPLEVLHPFFDLRLIDYLLAIPPVPFCADKAILRSAMTGILPEAVRTRPKTPMVADPLVANLRQCSSNNPINLNLVPQIEKYVDAKAVPPVAGGEVTGNQDELWVNLRPRHLSDWLRITPTKTARQEELSSVGV